MTDDQDKDEDMARRIWLAGIGAYGRAFGEAQEAAGKLGKESVRLFDEMVSRGKKIEEQVSERVTETGKKLMPQGSTSMEERIKRMRTALGMETDTSQQGGRLDRLEADVAAMNTKLDHILALVEAQSPTAKPASKATQKRRTAAARKKPTTPKSGS